MVPSALVNFELNGERRDDLGGDPDGPEGPLTVLALLTKLDLADRRVAVAINAEVVPRSSFLATRIREGDRVEVIQAVGGG